MVRVSGSSGGAGRFKKKNHLLPKHYVFVNNAGIANEGSGRVDPGLTRIEGSTEGSETKPEGFLVHQFLFLPPMVFCDLRVPGRDP